MSEDGVSDVAVPTSTYYLTWKALDPAAVAATALDSVGKSSKLSGIHGVALLGVTAKGSSGDVKLVKGKTNDVPASPDLAFVVRVQNQGSVAENDVPVTATLDLPGGDPIKQEASIATIARRQDPAGHHHRVRHPRGGAEQGRHAQGHRRSGQGRARGDQQQRASFKLVLQLK